jgi:hypothetical protein
MTKKSRTRSRSTDELLASFEQSLTTLQHFARLYDSGYAPVVFAIATEIHKILVENNAAMRLRGELAFTSPDHGDVSNMLNALHKLTGAQVGGHPPAIEFLPAFRLEDAVPLTKMKFRDWWNRDVIYRASAALPGTPAGMIPVNDSPSVPFQDRETLTRRELIELVRNKLGAHTESEFPILLEELDEARSWGGFAIETPDGVFDTDNGTLLVKVSVLPATVRQICHELLVAYGRQDTVVTV